MQQTPKKRLQNELKPQMKKLSKLKWKSRMNKIKMTSMMMKDGARNLSLYRREPSAFTT